jgi:hypothetical protein
MSATALYQPKKREKNRNMTTGKKQKRRAMQKPDALMIITHD